MRNKSYSVYRRCVCVCYVFFLLKKKMVLDRFLVFDVDSQKKARRLLGSAFFPMSHDPLQISMEPRRCPAKGDSPNLNPDTTGL